jgi:hypothetical protein
VVIARNQEIIKLGEEDVSMIRILCHLDSDTLHWPELRPLIGKTVEILIREDATPGIGDWLVVERAAERLRQSACDFDAWREQREYDLTQAQAQLG